MKGVLVIWLAFAGTICCGLDNLHYKSPPTPSKSAVLTSPVLQARGTRLSLRQANVSFRVVGPFMESTTILTFQNPFNETVEGLLEAPLPDETVVCGFALQVKGHMMDAVPVPKARARVVFDSLKSSGKTAALNTWVQGNMFRTRVHPIAAGSSAVVKLVYLTAVDRDRHGVPFFNYPLLFGQHVKRVHLHFQITDESDVTPQITMYEGRNTRTVAVQRKASTNIFTGTAVISDTAQPQGTASPSKRAGGSDNSEAKGPMLSLSRSVIIALPMAPSHKKAKRQLRREIVVVENVPDEAQSDAPPTTHHRSAGVMHIGQRSDDEPQRYFAVFHNPIEEFSAMRTSIKQMAQKNARMQRMNEVVGNSRPITSYRIRLFWDASLSRAKVNKEPSFQFLKHLFQHLSSPALQVQTTEAEDWQAGIHVEVFLFRNEPSFTRKFHFKEGEDCSELTEYLRSVIYDGATSFSTLPFSTSGTDDRTHGAGGGGAADTVRAGPPTRFALVFSDGMANIDAPSVAMPKRFSMPVFCVADTTVANYPLLHRVSIVSGGASIDLTRLSSTAAIELIAKPRLHLLSVHFDPQQATQVFPRIPQLVGHKGVHVTGRLLGPRASLVLNYGVGSHILRSLTVTVHADAALSGRMVRRHWAQQQVRELMIFPRLNNRLLAELGRRFGLVTPGSSALVLTTLEDYIHYGIVPPTSRPEWRRRYFEHMTQQDNFARADTEKRVELVKQYWQQLQQQLKKKASAGAHGNGRPQTGGTSVSLTSQSGQPLLHTHRRPGARKRDSEQPLLGNSLLFGQPSVGPHPAAATVHRAVSEATSAAQTPAGAAKSPDAKVNQKDKSPVKADRLADKRAADEKPALPARRHKLTSVKKHQVEHDAPSADRPVHYTPSVEPEPVVMQRIKPWDPQAPYLRAMAKVVPGLLQNPISKEVAARLNMQLVESLYRVYFYHRGDYEHNPAFYLDVSEVFLRLHVALSRYGLVVQRGKRAGQHSHYSHPVAVRCRLLSLRVLTNVVELSVLTAPMLRALGHRLQELASSIHGVCIGLRAAQPAVSPSELEQCLDDERSVLTVAVHVLQQALAMYPEKSSSYRDLALVLVDRASLALSRPRIVGSGGSLNSATYAGFREAVRLLHKVVVHEWVDYLPPAAAATARATDKVCRAEALSALLDVTHITSVVRAAEGTLAGKANTKGPKVAQPKKPARKSHRRLGSDKLALSAHLFRDINERFHVELGPDVQPVTLDLRITVEAEFEGADLVLLVTDPSGTVSQTQQLLRRTGAVLFEDCESMGAPGPVEYLLAVAPSGKYQIEVQYKQRSSYHRVLSSQELLGSLRVHVTLTLHYGRPNEHREMVSVQLPDTIVDGDTFSVGQFVFDRKAPSKTAQPTSAVYLQVQPHNRTLRSRRHGLVMGPPVLIDEVEDNERRRSRSWLGIFSRPVGGFIIQLVCIVAVITLMLYKGPLALRSSATPANPNTAG